ncbi:non-hydrolyzing UDP-N-acetylglucosamine 2-epimerase [Crateriforma spongiae]|uniref:non-hydrolyzing UDP-N-acetylglucosamine 2-epimerase n=1 Tax=Crateriforma spongiae TaxID=2724528 RepID=UPI0039AEF1FA
MKVAPLLRASMATGRISHSLIHTGQHYDKALSDVFFEQLDIPRPDVSLDVGSGTQAGQTAKILERIEPVLADGLDGEPFDWLIVVGDVNSTMAAALAAAKLNIPIAHVEAGLRSFDRTMPEEINRIVTDSISDLLLVSDPAGLEHLAKEGHDNSKVHLVGNLMIDTLMHSLTKAKELGTLNELGLTPSSYGLVTLHRPSNVDDPKTLKNLLDVLVKTSLELPLVFAVHPRTKARLESFGLLAGLEAEPNLTLLPPQGYLEFLCLSSQARVVVTDSGGLQEETTVLGIPCLTMRENTERPITVSEGSSTLIGNDADLLAQNLRLVLDDKYDIGQCPELWDGKAADRIVGAISGTLTAQPTAL